MEASCARVPPRLGESARSPGLVIVVLLLGLTAASAVLFFFNPTEHSFYPFCLFYRTTGLLCPGCGGLRAMHQLLHGHLEAAVRLNALFIASLPFVGWWGTTQLLARVRRQPSPVLVGSGWLWAGLVVMLLFGILRNLPFARAAWLAP